MHYPEWYVFSSNPKPTSGGVRVWSSEEASMRFFRNLRRRRRQPTPPFYLLELDLPFEDVMADLAYPAT